MAVVREESRCRIGIVWYDNEAEADALAAELAGYDGPANAGYVQVGRATSFDVKGPGGVTTEFAVVIP